MSAVFQSILKFECRLYHALLVPSELDGFVVTISTLEIAKPVSLHLCGVLVHSHCPHGVTKYMVLC